MKFWLMTAAMLIGVAMYVIAAIHAMSGDYAHACFCLLLGNLNFDFARREAEEP